MKNVFQIAYLLHLFINHAKRYIRKLIRRIEFENYIKNEISLQQFVDAK